MATFGVLYLTKCKNITKLTLNGLIKISGKLVKNIGGKYGENR